ncbi:histidine kinase [Paractinoplanes rishiriensis]|uniref:histidine kinase n=1 Tax=Paractinoplanes rishiriensis TaxID=1050105 RepID=A0A919JYE9_9ACTN|nr:histidine kinase [Actinoplanes rishiriensis]GIE95592.1 hypothetical protein Ari01nite_30570 [Actinoplanes rishiriensis]
MVRLLIDVPLIAFALYIDQAWFLTGFHPVSSLLTAIAFLALLVRRRWPITVLILNAGQLIALGGWDLGSGLLIALHAVARHRDRRTSITAALACAVPVAVSDVASDGPDLIGSAMFAGLATAAWTLGYWMRRAAQEQQAAKAAQRARRAERSRLAQDLHGIITHSVEVMQRRAAEARAALTTDPDRAAQALEAVQDAGTRSMAELRRMLTVMRLVTDDEPAADPARRAARQLLVDGTLITVAFAVDWYVWLPEDFTYVHAGVLLTLLLGRRWPLPVLLIHVVYLIELTKAQPYSDYIVGPLIALHAVARGYDRRVSIVPACTTGAAYAYAAILATKLQNYGEPARPVEMVLLGTPYALLAIPPWLLGYSMHRTAEGRAAARAAEQERRAERLQLARELHDIVSHTVTMMLLQAAGARSVLTRNPARAQEALDAIREAGDRSMTELARLLTLLTPATDAAPAEHPGLDGLDDLLARMRTTGLTVTAGYTGTPADLDPSVDLTAYRVIQEALTNSTKYAGPGSTALLHLTWTATDLDIEVTDRRAGKRTTVPSTGHGLVGLGERVTAIGGTFQAGPGTDGFRVTAKLPLAPVIAWSPEADRSSA